MKKREMFIRKSFFTSLLLLILVSCATTNNTNNVKTNSKAAIEEENDVVISPEEIFIQEMNKYSIEFTKVPEKTKKGKTFNSGFEATVKDENGNPSADFSVCFTYPVKKEGSKLVTESKVVKTNENGIASLSFDSIDFAVKTSITAMPDAGEYSEKIAASSELTLPCAKADFLVESDVATKGAIMFVFEYTESGKPSKNSYEILSGLRKKGVYQIGNAPISDTEYINASKEKIYKENYEYVGTDFGYLIGGTVKFAGPVEQTDDGYVATLVADIYGIDMKTGAVIYENKHEAQATGTNWNNAVSTCREKLTKIVVDEIMFGL